MKLELIRGAVCLLMLVAGGVAVWVKDSHAQKAERGTQQWSLPVEGTGYGITIIDTTGVCLYASRGEYGYIKAIAAVPKSHLPIGAGCQ